MRERHCNDIRDTREPTTPDNTQNNTQGSSTDLFSFLVLGERESCSENVRWSSSYGGSGRPPVPDDYCRCAGERQQLAGAHVKRFDIMYPFKSMFSDPSYRTRQYLRTLSPPLAREICLSVRAIWWTIHGLFIDYYFLFFFAVISLRVRDNRRDETRVRNVFWG